MWRITSRMCCDLKEIYCVITLGNNAFWSCVTGVGGNLVAVQASRITTSLHMSGSKPGRLPSGALKGCPNPGGAFCGTSKSSNIREVTTDRYVILLRVLVFINSFLRVSLNFSVMIDKVTFVIKVYAWGTFITIALSSESVNQFHV